jgi:hypothetical protein
MTTMKAFPDLDSDGSLPGGIYDFEPSDLIPNFPNAPEQPAQTTASGFSQAGTTALLVLLVLLSTILLLMTLNMCRRHCRNASNLNPRERVPKPEIDPRRIERRYETIEGWLITKKTQKHDAVCEKLVVASAQRKEEASPVEKCTHIKCLSSHDTSETDDECSFDYEEKECPICMEGLELGDAVSWSPNEECSHVFHHECIKEWLLKHVECPL